MQSVMFVIQPLIVILLSVGSLWVIGVGIWHLTGWDQAPSHGERWLTGDRRVISAGLASLAAISVMVRTVLARFGKLPESGETGDAPVDSSLKDELDERFDGLAQRLTRIEHREAKLDSDQRNAVATLQNELAQIRHKFESEPPPTDDGSVRANLSPAVHRAVDNVRQILTAVTFENEVVDTVQAAAYLARLEAVLDSADRQALFELLEEITETYN